MSEEAEQPPSPETQTAPTNPAAIALALAGASREKADAFLDDQRRILQLQIGQMEAQEAHIKEEETLKLAQHRLETSHLRLRRFGDYAKVAFELSIGLLMLAAVSGLGLMVWSATHAEGLIIEAFSVPPDLANRGITGQVVASQMLDQLTALQNSTQSSRPAQSYANSWGTDLKVEIPDTGISIGEAYRFLRGWLGHETHVSGEVIRTATGVAITARTGGNSGVTFAATEADLDALVLKSALQIYRVTQPDRYARYLFFPRPGVTPDFDGARDIFNQMIRDAVPAEKGWAWYGLGIMDRYQGNNGAAIIDMRAAIAANSKLVLPSASVALAEEQIGHLESALSTAQKVQPMLDRPSSAEINPGYGGTIAVQIRYLVAFLLGDYRNAVVLAKPGAVLAQTRSLSPPESYYDKVIYALSMLHDGAGMHSYWSHMPTPQTPQDKANREITRLRAEEGFGHYQNIAATEVDVERTAAELGVTSYIKDIAELQLRPLLALAKAKLGDIAAARALIAATPLDCYDCVRTRALIAAAAGEHGQADRWFARAVHAAPSIPKAYADWGDALVARGQPDTAIAQFKLANEKGPHFADALEGWGEALMAKNQSHLALAKFAEAEKYAPNWGRLQLKWGEALAYAGKRDEAKKHLTHAAALELTPSEKTELGDFPASHI